MPDKYKPDEEYVRHIPNRRLHLFTLIQVVMLCLLCIFKVVSQISIIFPVMVSRATSQSVIIISLGFTACSWTLVSWMVFP